MRKLIQFWIANKKKILTFIGVLALVIFIVHFLNNIIEQNHEESKNTISTHVNTQENPTKSIITGVEISTQTAVKNSNIINQFVQYCNDKKYQEAYNLISSDCKREIFNNNVNLFISNYAKKIFDTNKMYNISLWAVNSGNYIYQIRYYEGNLLATGGKESNKNIEDYITIMQENNENKLNLNSFISYQYINKTVSKNNIIITINSKKTYKSYEEYSFTVKNNTNKTIDISTSQNIDDIYLIDKNNNTYGSMLYEIPNNLLQIEPGYQNNIDLKFDKVYNTYRVIDKIIFKNITLDSNGKDKNVNKEVIEIQL